MCEIETLFLKKEMMNISNTYSNLWNTITNGRNFKLHNTIYYYNQMLAKINTAWLYEKTDGILKAPSVQTWCRVKTYTLKQVFLCTPSKSSHKGDELYIKTL